MVEFSMEVFDTKTVRGQIDGLPYSQTERNGDSTHYLLTIPYDTACQILTDKYGRSTGSITAIRNSTPLFFRFPNGMVIYEVTAGRTTERRLVTRGETRQTGVYWNK
jgi:hypothetical protein